MVRNSLLAASCTSLMEPTFYEEAGGLYGPGAQAHPHELHQHHQHHLGGLKKTMTLELNSRAGGAGGAGPAKRPRLTVSTGGAPALGPSSGITPLLSSPDLMKLNTPELERLIGLQQAEGPGGQLYFGDKLPTEAQEQYARGFVEALNELHHSDSSQEPLGLGALGPTYTNLEPPSSVQSNESSSAYGGPGGFGTPGSGSGGVKDEPQTVPSVTSSPPMSPIDMESQERIKLERKRQRNRLAASKCRKRKLERISRLEDKVRQLKGENSDLSQVVNRLKEHVCRLKEQVMDHVHSGCQIMLQPGTF